MKNITKMAIIAIVFAANFASAQSITEKWPAIKSFHEVMSKTFHPTEEGNFAPLRSMSETLMTRAQELTTKEIPAEYKTKAIMTSVEKLQKQTANINKMVAAKASDDALKAAIAEAHDTFHEIVGLCSAEKH